MHDRLLMGQRIRRQRESRGYTREQLAEMIDITPRFCYDLELGTKGMSIDTLSLLKTALHTTTDYILFGPEDTEHDDNYEILISLINSCPKHKRKHLKTIVSSYVQAITNPE